MDPVHVTEKLALEVCVAPVEGSRAITVTVPVPGCTGVQEMDVTLLKSRKIISDPFSMTFHWYW